MNRKVTEPDDTYVVKVWQWCRDAMATHQRKLSFPARTDPKKTYQWRSAKALAARFNEWDMDDETAKRYVEIATAHGQRGGLLNKGLGLYLQANLVEVVRDELKRCHQRVLSDLDLIRRRWPKLHADLSQALTRQAPGATSMLVVWFRAGELTPTLLALSKTAGRALQRLAVTSPTERANLPADLELYRLRHKLLADETAMTELAAILGDDLKKE